MNNKSVAFKRLGLSVGGVERRMKFEKNVLFSPYQELARYCMVYGVDSGQELQ
jgi:hypothetical protein